MTQLADAPDFGQFSGVLWSIRPLLLGVADAYAIDGSLLAALVGRRLIGLNGQQLDREANFRSELIQIRDNYESVAVMHREDFVRRRVLQRLDKLVANARQLIGVNRNLGFFTNGYNDRTGTRSCPVVHSRPNRIWRCYTASNGVFDADGGVFPRHHAVSVHLILCRCGGTTRQVN
jgi:ABC transporter transmembrane region 2